PSGLSRSTNKGLGLTKIVLKSKSRLVTSSQKLAQPPQKRQKVTGQTQKAARGPNVWLRIRASSIVRLFGCISTGLLSPGWSAPGVPESPTRRAEIGGKTLHFET